MLGLLRVFDQKQLETFNLNVKKYNPTYSTSELTCKLYMTQIWHLKAINRLF